MNQVRFVLSYCWILICFPNIFSTNCHIVCVEPKIFKMTIILARSGRLFWSFFRKLILCNDCRRNCWLNLTVCLFDIISSNWRIRIWFPNIFSSNCHVVCIEPKIFKMTIILARSRRLFWSFFRKWILCNDCRRNCWLSLTDCLFDIISSNWRIRIWFPFIFSSDCHIIWIISEICKVSIVLARGRCLFLWSSIRRSVFSD
jgi:hypothetical protein